MEFGWPFVTNLIFMRFDRFKDDFGRTWRYLETVSAHVWYLETVSAHIWYL